MIDPINANPKAIAIGLNILPSTPCNEKIGTKTIRIIACPKKAERIILFELSIDRIFFSSTSASPDNLSNF